MAQEVFITAANEVLISERGEVFVTDGDGRMRVRLTGSLAPAVSASSVAPAASATSLAPRVLAWSIANGVVQ